MSRALGHSVRWSAAGGQARTPLRTRRRAAPGLSLSKPAQTTPADKTAGLLRANTLRSASACRQENFHRYACCGAELDHAAPNRTAVVPGKPPIPARSSTNRSPSTIRSAKPPESVPDGGRTVPRAALDDRETPIPLCEATSVPGALQHMIVWSHHRHAREGGGVAVVTGAHGQRGAACTSRRR